MARHPRIKVTEDYVDMTALALDSVAIDLASGTPVDETVDRLRRIANNMRRRLGATCEEQHGHSRRINHQRVWARVASEYEEGE